MKVILVIDDDPLTRELIGDLLQAQGFQAITAENGRIGLEQVQQQLPDLILCDIQMPEMDGYEVLRSLQQSSATSTIPFIFLTARTDNLDLRQGMNLGADDYLTKPCSAAELLNAVRSRLSKQDVVLAQSQQQLESLRSSIALSLPHELRTPLTGILTSVELLRLIANAATPTDLLEIADTIESSAQKLHQLIQNFLLYARLELNAHDPNYVRSPSEEVVFQPQPIIENTATRIARQMERHADLQMRLQSATIAFSVADLEKVTAELVTNALKFSNPGTTVEVVSCVELDTYEIRVINGGRGMTLEQIARRGAYMQFDRQTYEQQGVGLGLAIAQRLVELQGGRLTVESSPNQRTIVRVAIPLAVVKEEE